MILVDTALRQREAEGHPIQVALIGAGFMAQGLANQIAHSVPGMRVAAIYARRLEQAHGIFGPMSPRDWHRWAWKHTDYHLRQFGV